MTRRLIDAFVRRGDASTRPVDRQLAQLTPRELEVLGLLARGLSNLDIAEPAVHLRGHHQDPRQQMLAKLGLRDRVQAVIFAYENGVVIPGAEDRSRD